MSNRSSRSPAAPSANTTWLAASSSRVPSTNFNHEAVLRRIRRAGMEVLTVTELSNGTGMKYRLLGGAVVTVYYNGNYLIQGRVSDADRKRLDRVLGTR